MKSFRYILYILLFVPCFTFAKPKISSDESKNSSLLKAVNTAVDVLEKRISENDTSMPLLKVEYDLLRPTEGVPPDLRFYYETKTVGSKEKSVLRVFKTHVGHEVYSIDRTYYFDEAGKPMKFLYINSGMSGEGGFPASRTGIIYEKSGRKIWSSPDTSIATSFKDVSYIFETLDKGIVKFH